MAKRSNYKTGDVIGNCIFINSLGVKIYGQSKKQIGLFQCSCGKKFKAIISQVKDGNTKSCGCINILKIKTQGFKNKKHGQRKHPLYKTWRGMIRRCTAINSNEYKNYGARGIKVCDRWLDINNFLQDMYPSYNEKLQLDRIDVNGNYCIENCRWVTAKENMNNTRINRFIEYNGEVKTLSQWADYLNIPYKTLINRVNKWDTHKAFTYPIKQRINNGKINKTKSCSNAP